MLRRCVLFLSACVLPQKITKTEMSLERNVLRQCNLEVDNRIITETLDKYDPIKDGNSSNNISNRTASLGISRQKCFYTCIFYSIYLRICRVMLYLQNPNLPYSWGSDVGSEIKHLPGKHEPRLY